MSGNPSTAPASFSKAKQAERRSMYLLKQILLKEDRDELEQLKIVLNNPELLSEKVSPIIEEHMEFLKANFPIEFQHAVENIVERKLEASRQELLDVIYPTLGQMVRKYIQHQFQLLKEGLEQQIHDAFNKGIIGRLRFALFGVKPKTMSNAILRALDGPLIEEIYVIEHHSGILLGSASRQETIDLDIIAGMLTAIKSFVEDAYKRGEENLEMIQYGTFRIFIQNFHSYYIATALTGSLSTQEKDQLSEDLIKFAKTELQMNLKKADGSSNLLIKKKLEKHFLEPQHAALIENQQNEQKK